MRLHTPEIVVLSFSIGKKIIMKIFLNLFKFFITLLLSSSVTAQVSNVEGLTPLDGVVIPKPGAVFKDCDECPEMVVIPAGSHPRPFRGV